MSFAPSVSRVIAEARAGKAKPAGDSPGGTVEPRWRPWLESAAPVRWDDSEGAPRGVSLRGNGTPLGDAVWTFGTRTFRADFDGGNLARVERVKDTSFHLWTRADNEGTPHESHHRTWFHFSVEGCDVGETLTFTFVDYNKQKTLFSNDFRPVYRVHGSMRSYQRVKFPVTSHLRDDGQFRFSFKHRFASSCPAYFAFSFPFGYHDAVAMLDNVDARFADPTHGPPLRERVWWTRETLARSVEGRSVEMVTVTDPEGMDPARAPGSVRVPEGRQVFVVTCGVHPGEKPANHMLCGVLEFLLRADDPRAEALRKAYVFRVVPMLNPDGAFRGHYRNDASGQNLNRCYDAPDPRAHPTIAATWAMLMRHAEKNELGFYVDLHGHVNKRGCFAFGNALRDEAATESYAWARLVALNNPHFDLGQCNFTEKNMSTRDKNGDSKEGSGRVALYRATGLHHLYTVEANYNSSRLLGATPPASGDDGRASPPSKGVHPIKYTPEIFNGVGRSLLIAALDLRGANPWSRVPMSEHKSLKGVRAWARAAARGDGAAKTETFEVAVSKRWGTARNSLLGQKLALR